MVKIKETSNPNPKPSKNSSSVRAIWTSRQTTIFCEACVDEVFKGNQPSTCFNKKGWNNIIEAFEKNTGKKYSRDKFKHTWDGLKKEWILWNKLIGSESGLGWDAAKGTISATDEWWERKLMEVPDAAKFREKGLENVELLDIMFKDIATTGELAWAPTSGVLPDDIETRKEGLGEISTDTSSPDNNDDDDPNEVETPNPTQPLNPIQPTQDKGKKLALPSSTQGKGKKGGAALKMTQQLSRMCDVVESRNLVISVEPGSTIRNVMERVCTLDGIEKGSELYFMAARIFQKREKREMFVVMGEPYLYPSSKMKQDC
ncbi:L10-interacting MYB domain-containing protein-like [Castanea sativa]|uniref:L10-interacting MYB domain-containing protein-like n=1 Tax=Castanea sativa TaxID=21020 RepID=UPI003F64E7BC